MAIGTAMANRDPGSAALVKLTNLAGAHVNLWMEPSEFAALTKAEEDVSCADNAL